MAPVAYSGVPVRTFEGEQSVKLTVKPISSRESGPVFLLISLESMAAEEYPAAPAEEVDLGAASREQLTALEAELRYTKENLQATVEEMETSNEELQATNEELVASNEELQSTNEELHSVNEELYTVNAEYQRKIYELTELNDDMDNLFRSIDVGTVFLDQELRIRKFNPRIAATFHILPQDVGRPIDSFSHNLDVEDLLGIVKRVLSTEKPFEQKVRDREGNWLLMRILPYRAKSRVEGVVLSLIDIALLRETEKQLGLMSKVFMDSADPIIIEDLSGRIIALNAEAERVYGWNRSELMGKDVETVIPPEERERSTDLRQRCRRGEGIRSRECLRLAKSGRLLPMLLTLSLLSDESGEPMAIASIACHGAQP
jgi:two-component system CheB/CheR fusion protein